MKTEITNNVVDSVHCVGMSNGSGDYVLWQIDCDGSQPPYLEWNDQVNGGYHEIEQCLLMRDGMHIVLKNQTKIHNYFNGLSTEDWKRFLQGVKDVFEADSSPLEILDE